MQEKKLGRGLDYLLNLTSKETIDENKISNIKIIDIRRNRYQPRESINEETLNELISSIKENGILQPILVRKDGIYYELIAGERRLKACIALAKETIPSIILDIPENKLLQLALIENIQREDLNPIDEAKAYLMLMKLENLTHEEISLRVGKKRSTITNYLRLLDLPQEIQESVSRGTISQGHARALLSFKTKNEMINAYNKIKSNKFSVRDIEKLSKVKDTGKKHISKDSIKNANIKSFEEELKNIYSTKVDICVSGDKGSINLHFYSNEDFTRLISMLKNLS